MERAELIKRLEPYKITVEIQHALDILFKADSQHVANEDIGDIWERVSVALAHELSDDENHPMWALELELSQVYKRT